MLKFILGILLGIIGVLLLGSIVAKASYLAWAQDDLAVQFVLSLGGLAMIHLGYRLVTSSRQADKGE